MTPSIRQFCAMKRQWRFRFRYLLADGDHGQDRGMIFTIARVGEEYGPRPVIAFFIGHQYGFVIKPEGL